MISKVLKRAFSVISAASACFCLYYGGVMLLLVPGYAGEFYLSWGRLTYGVLPILLSIGLLRLSVWFWKASNRLAA
jgi:hypothetical protein